MKKLLPSHIYEARRHNLKLLLEGRSQKDLQLLTGASQATFSHCLNGRNMSTETARLMEDRLGLNPLWMDAFQQKAPDVFQQGGRQNRSEYDLYKSITALGATVEADPSFNTPYGHLHPTLLVVTASKRFAIEVKSMTTSWRHTQDSLLADVMRARSIDLDIFFVLSCDPRTSLFNNTMHVLGNLAETRMLLGFTLNEDPLPALRNLLAA